MKPMNFDYEQQMRFMQLYNAALASQAQDAKWRASRRLSRNNSFTYPGPHFHPEYDRGRFPPPVRRADSSGKLEMQRRSVSRTSSESGYNSNLEYRRQSRSLDRGLTRKSSTLSDSGTYEGYPRIRRVSVVKEQDNRPPTPPIIKRKGSSVLSSISMSPSVRFSTVEDIMSAYDQGETWSGRYKPRMSISSDRESHISAHSMNEFDKMHGRRSSSESRGFDHVDARRRSFSSHRKGSSSSRRSSSSSRRPSSSSRRPSSSSRRASSSSRKSSVSSRRGSVVPEPRRESIISRASFSADPQILILNPNGMEGAEIMRRLSKGSEMKEWERSMIMRRRSSNSSRRGSKSSQRRSSVCLTSSSSSGSDSDSSSSSGSGSSDSDSESDSDSDSSSGSDSESESEDEDKQEKDSSRRESHATAASKYGIVGENDANRNANGARTSQVNGGLAFASDGDANFGYRRMEDDNTSSLCVIL